MRCSGGVPAVFALRNANPPTTSPETRAPTMNATTMVMIPFLPMASVLAFVTAMVSDESPDGSDAAFSGFLLSGWLRLFSVMLFSFYLFLIYR